MLGSLFNFFHKFIKNNPTESHDRALDYYYRIEYVNKADGIYNRTYRKNELPLCRVRIQDRLGNCWYEDRQFTDVDKDRIRRL